MATLEDKFSSLYGTEAYGGVATVFLPGIQGASVAGPQGDKGDKGDKGDRGPEGPQGTTGIVGAQVDLIPDFSSRVFLAVGGILGALCSFLFGPIDDAIEWLFVFIVVDYLSGTYAAMKTGQWNSRTGFLGITKKIVMLSLVALCHGLDITSVIPFVSVRDAAVFAFCLNDFGSILENIERMGYGSIIPAPVRKMLKAMEERSEAMASDVVSGGEIHRQHRDK